MPINSNLHFITTVLHREMKTGISEASKRVSIFSFATQGGKQVSFYIRQRNWVQAREAQIRFPKELVLCVQPRRLCGNEG